MHNFCALRCPPKDTLFFYPFEILIFVWSNRFLSMKNISKITLIISFLIVVLACSALSMSSVASNYRFTWVAMNPWNGVEGIAFTVGYFLHTDKTVSMLISIGVLLVIWWRLYALIRRTFGI